MNFYVSIFKDAAIINISRMGDKVFSGTLQLFGQQFYFLNGGPAFQFTEAISMFISCDTQQEVDYYWEQLTAGGAASQCGWLKDKFGLSWQVIPTALGRLLGDPDRVKAGRVMQAMLQMSKIEIAVLQQAYDAQ
jgi:predicted 3-demethylubiquinone-9 3-methyltransferase (glyoxalase superfamily)